MTATKKKALGRGLSALLESAETDVTSSSGTPDNSKTVGSVSMLKLENIEPNPFQPRLHFTEEALVELADSIREHGIIQPLAVRKLGFDKFQIISGERRFRASKIAGLEEVPAYIRIANDQSMLEMALVENVQRENLDPIETALGYKRLIDECKITQEELAEKVGKKRSTVTNTMRLLKLPVDIQVALKEGLISMGHARTLVNIEDPDIQLGLLQEILSNQLSVRQTEGLVKSEKIKPASSNPKKAATPLPWQQERIRDDLARILRSNVELKRNNKGKGKLVISFDSDADLERIFDRLQS